MNKPEDFLEENELLKRVEDLIDKKDANQKYTNSFLGFCSRLLSIRPKAEGDFQISLQQELLKKHPIHLEKKAETGKTGRSSKFNKMIGEFITRKNVKRFTFAAVPTLVILLAFAFTMIITPQLQEARAMEVVANDPQVRAVIEEYNLEVQEVKVKGNIAYIFLDQEDLQLQVTIAVDLDNGTVGKIVKMDGKTYKTENIGKSNPEFETKAEAKKMTAAEYKAYLSEQFEVKAEAMRMTVEEYKTHLAQQKKAKHESFKAEAQAKGMTVEKYKVYLVEQYEAKAEAKGMTVEQFKKYLLEQIKS